MMVRDFGLGALPNPVDTRDYLLSDYLIASEPLPEKYSFRDKMTPVKNQSNVPFCVAYAVNAMKEFYDSEEYNKTMNFSEQWLYGECKKQDGIPNRGGTYPRVAYKILKNTGVPEERFLPFENNFPSTNDPKEGWEENANKYQIKSYAVVGTHINQIKQGVFENGPVGVSVWVYENMYRIGNSGIMKKPEGQKVGGHMMVCTGFDDTRKHPYGQGVLEIKNSWGNYGDRGYLYIPYNVWNTVGLETGSIVDKVNLKKYWEDWPNYSLLNQKLLWEFGAMKGYEDGTFKPWNFVLKRHIGEVFKHLGEFKENPWENDYSVASRGWVKDKMPFLEWKEERWNENLTRFQLGLLISRYIKKNML